MIDGGKADLPAALVDARATFRPRCRKRAWRQVRRTVGADREHVPGVVVAVDLTTGEEVALDPAS